MSGFKKNGENRYQWVIYYTYSENCKGGGRRVGVVDFKLDVEFQRNKMAGWPWLKKN